MGHTIYSLYLIKRNFFQNKLIQISAFSLITWLHSDYYLRFYFNGLQICTVECLVYYQHKECGHGYVSDSVVLFSEEMPYEADKVNEGEWFTDVSSLQIEF